MDSNTFTRITAQLQTFLNQDKSYTLPASSVPDKNADALKTLISQLPGQRLGLTNATITPSTDSKWVVAGTPTTAWPLPGFKTATLDIAGATAKLTVTDKGEGTDPDYELNYTGTITLGSAKVPVSLTAGGDGKQKVEVGDKKGKQDLPLGNLITDLKLDALVTALTGVSELLPLKDARLISATVNLKNDDDPTKPPAIKGGTISGSLGFAKGVTVQLTVNFTTATASKPTVTATWPSPDQPSGSCTINTLLSGMGAPFPLPSALDVTLKSFSLSYVYIAEKDQLNPNDTRRLVLSSPAQSVPDFRIAWSFDEDKKLRTVVRANWGSVALKGLPVVGDHLPGKLEPIVLLMFTQELTVKEAASLANMKDFSGLETLATPEKKVKTAPPFPAGIHCVALFTVPNKVDIACNFPLYKFSQSSAAALKRGPGRAAESPSDQLAPSNEATSVPVQQNVGPVRLDRIGFRFENGAVSVLLNVVLTSGALSLEMVGLRASFSVSDRSLSAGLDGLLVSYKSSGVSLAGGFIRDTQGGGTDWGGTALVRVGDKFAIQGVGAFSDGSPKKFFLFCNVNRQLGGPPWLVFTGLAAAFGYNRAFTIPPVDQVDQFPFIQMANNLARGTAPVQGNDLNPDALWKLMNSIEKYLGPSNGTDFVTVGFTATSFGLVNSTVLATLVFGSSTEFVLLGSSSISVPQDAPVAHAEVEVVASVQPNAGLAAIDGQLAPGSYVLSKACHLTGGFAFHFWFSGSHGGDFIFTLGGYNPIYVPPAHYPQVPRLAFVWQVSSEVLMTGSCYFALTPSSVQVGGGLHIVLQAGPLSVWCIATADFFLQWLPFFYEVKLYVDFGVSFELKLLFVTITITVDLTAELEIWGPAFSGHAAVDLWFVSFGVNFGAGASKTPPPANWKSFLTSLVLPVAARTVALKAANDPQPGAVQVVPVNGLAEAPAGSNVDWIADPQQTELTLATVIPAATATMNGQAVPVDGQTFTIRATPLAQSPVINPELSVTVAGPEGTTSQWQATAVTGQVPAAVWGGGSSSNQGELVPAITGLRLYTNPERPDETVPVEVSVLLFDNEATISVAWQTPSVPAGGSFNWNDNNPFKTIGASAVAAQRAALLQIIASEGYLDPAAISAINVSFVTPGQPCFMANPVLCRLGAEQFT